MLHDVVDDPGERTESELLAAHADQLAEVVNAVGPAAAAASLQLPESTVDALADGDPATAGDLDVEVAAAVLALPDGNPSPDDIVAAATESLLFGMTTGVSSVDVVAGEVSLDLEPREVQGMVEGRHPMSLREYVALQRAIAARRP